MRKKERKRENVCEREGENEEVLETGSREENEENERESEHLFNECIVYLLHKRDCHHD